MEPTPAAPVLEARLFVFQEMDATGISIESTATLGMEPDDLRNGTFDVVAPGGSLLRIDQARLDASVPGLQHLGLGDRRVQSYRDVVGEVIAAGGQHGGMADASFDQADEIARAAADVDQGDAQLALVVGQNGFIGSELFQNDRVGLDPGAVHARNQRLDRRQGADHQVHVDLESAAGHAQRVDDVSLLVDREFAR